MPTHNHWRNKQLAQNLCWQEHVCLRFLMQHNDITWQWHGPFSNFYHYCKQFLQFDDIGNGAIFINPFYQLSPKNIVNQLDKIDKNNLKVIYLAINRYELLPENDLQLSYPESLGDSLDLIISQCSIPFKRLYCPLSTGGHNFVGSHGLDTYVYECD